MTNLNLPQPPRPTPPTPEEQAAQAARQQFLYNQALTLLQTSRGLLVCTLSALQANELPESVLNQLHQDGLSMAAITTKKE